MDRLRTLSGVLILAVVVGACGGADSGDTTPTTAPTTTAPTTTAPTTTVAPTTTAVPTTTVPASDTTWPGEPFDLGPQAGDELGVVGVEADDVLNVRAGPGTANEIIDALDPTAEGVVATGHNRLLTESIWYEIEIEDGTGWVSSRFVAYIGMTDDVTAQIIDQMGERPVAETMLDLGAMVAEHVAGDEEQIRVSLTVTPSVGDLGEVTYDVIGFLDDSVLGVRLHVFGAPGDEGFGLRTVEQTLLCRRGVTSSGLCV
jgi:hypothetical protein